MQLHSQNSKEPTPHFQYSINQTHTSHNASCTVLSKSRNREHTVQKSAIAGSCITQIQNPTSDECPKYHHLNYPEVKQDYHFRRSNKLFLQHNSLIILW